MHIGLVGKEKSAEWYDDDNQKNVGMFDNNDKHIMTSKIIKNHKKLGDLLEIGCNDGRLFKFMDGFNCHGQDISKFVIERAKKLGDGEFKGLQMPIMCPNQLSPDLCVVI